MTAQHLHAGCVSVTQHPSTGYAGSKVWDRAGQAPLTLPCSTEGSRSHLSVWTEGQLLLACCLPPSQDPCGGPQHGHLMNLKPRVGDAHFRVVVPRLAWPTDKCPGGMWSTLTGEARAHYQGMLGQHSASNRVQGQWLISCF